MVKINYLAGNDEVSIWLDPVLSSEPVTPDLFLSATEVGGSLAFDRLGFSDYVTKSGRRFDELRLGSDWDSATPLQIARSYPIYELISGSGDSDNSSFAISGDLLLTLVLLFEGLYRVRIRVTDSAGLSREEAFLVLVELGQNDTNGDGVRDADAVRLGFEPTGPSAKQAYFGKTAQPLKLSVKDGVGQLDLAGSLIPNQL
ncbi:hypothetical protein AAFN60_06370 [Roseibacillus persicicus]|uniref:hypothetical protein n=1 Tax=Roseibacillus persicicus TaxID=454148 RepID=UPI00398AD68D